MPDTPKDNVTTSESELVEEVRQLRTELARLNNHRFIKVQNSMPRLIGFQLLRGLALGLGTVIGASALVSLFAFFLSQIDFIPILGDWASELARQIEAEVEANDDGSINRNSD